jgi:hypothetical protein
VIARTAIGVIALLAGPAYADGVSIGARIAPQWVFFDGDGPPADLTGDAVGIDVAYPVSERVAIAGAVDAALYTQRSDRLPPGPSAHDVDAFAELQIDTDPHGSWSARIALGTGIRRLTLPLDAGPTDRFTAWEPLRLHVGPAWHTGHGVQLALMAGFGFGFMMSRARDGVCAVTSSCADSLYDSDSQSSAHFVADLTLAGRL